jgi:hypothetical protein
MVALLVMLPLWPSGTVPAEEVTTPTFFTGPAVRELPRDSVVLVLPWPNRRAAMAMTWQAETGLWYRMPGGYFIGPRRDSVQPRFDAIPTSGSITFSRIFGGAPPPRLTGHGAAPCPTTWSAGGSAAWSSARCRTGRRWSPS